MPLAATGLQMHLILKTSCKKRVYSQYVVLSADEMKIEEAMIVYKHPEIFCFNEGRVRLLM